jgi:hypothetical protein
VFAVERQGGEAGTPIVVLDRSLWHARFDANEIEVRMW